MVANTYADDDRSVVNYVLYHVAIYGSAISTMAVGGAVAYTTPIPHDFIGLYTVAVFSVAMAAFMMTMYALEPYAPTPHRKGKLRHGRTE